MSRKIQLQRSFAAGEVSPLLRGRVDLVPYQTGLDTCQNFITLPQGPARFRPGLQFEQYAADDRARLIPFVYSDDQAYIVEVSGAGVIRIHTLNGALLDDLGDQPIVAIAQANPATIQFAAGVRADGDFVYLDVTGMAEVDGRWYTLDFVSTDGVNDTFILATPTLPTGIDSTGYTAFTAGTASIPLELAHPYLEVDLPELRFAQSADVLTITSPDHPVYTLQRTGPNTWAFAAETFAPGVATPSSLTATPGGPGGGTPATHYYTVTAIVTDGSANAESFAFTPAASASRDLTVVGNYIDLASGTPVAGTRHNYYKALNGLYGFIGQGGGTFRDNNIIPDLSIAPPEFGTDFSATGDYPRAVAYHQQRKVFAGSLNAPQTVWMTRTGTEIDLTYTVPSRDDNSVVFRIASRELHTIQHLVALRDLLLLTTNGVWKVVAQNSDTITPASVAADIVSYNGANRVQPVTTEAAVLYAFNRGGRIGEIRYTESVADYAVSDISLLAPHLFDGYTVVDLCMVEVPQRVLWVLRSDGTLLSMTYQPDQKVVAWHKHDVGGAVRAICALPSAAGAVSEDVLVALVERDFGLASRVATLEVMQGFGDYPTEHKTDYFAAQTNLAASMAVYVDSALVYDGAAATRIIGLHHLEGQEVSLLTDGAVAPPQTVTNGEIVLEAEASRVVVGLPYTGRLKTLPLQLETLPADGQGMLKNVSAVHLRFFQTGGVFAGPSFDDMVELKSRTDEMYGVAPAWKTGEYEQKIPPLWGKDATVCVEQRDPLPLILLSMVIDAEVGG